MGVNIYHDNRSNNIHTYEDDRNGGRNGTVNKNDKDPNTSGNKQAPANGDVYWPDTGQFYHQTTDSSNRAYVSVVQTNTKNYTKGNANADNMDSIVVTDPSIQDDDGKTASLVRGELTDSEMSYALRPDVTASLMKHIMHSANQYTNAEIKSRLYNQTFRFGLRDTYGTLGSAREYLFFTKPDLHIFQADEYNSQINTSMLVDGLRGIPFWNEMALYRNDTTLKALQLTRDLYDPFNHLLQNMVKSNLEVPSLSSETIDTPTNMYGVGYSYRGSSEASDDNPTFSLEFRDNRYLDVYSFFKCYEEYETLKHHGVIEPQMPYIMNKIIHDQFSIYKFIVADDMETILYYGKMYGVMPLSLPRDVFGNPQFDDGISYTVDFKAAFYEDMKPDILADFNRLSVKVYNDQKYQINPYNISTDKGDLRTARAAAVIKDTTSEMAKMSTAGYVYKLKWRGSEVI